MAGFFGLFDYTKEGLGVSKRPTQKKRFFYFWELYFRKFGKLVLLNLLYFVCCIPIVTIGAATGGFFYVLRKMATEEPIFLVSDFFDGFRKNWKQSTAVFLLDIVLFILLPFAISFYSAGTQDSWFYYIPLILCGSLLVVYILMHYYIHLLIVTTNLRLKHILKNSLYLCAAGLKTNLITSFFLLLLLAGAVLLCLFVIEAVVLIPLILLSTIGFIICFNSFQYILKFVVEPFYRDMPSDQIPANVKRLLHMEEEEEEEDEEAVFRDMGEETPGERTKDQPRTRGKNKTIS